MVGGVENIKTGVLRSMSWEQFVPSISSELPIGAVPPNVSLELPVRTLPPNVSPKLPFRPTPLAPYAPPDPVTPDSEGMLGTSLRRGLHPAEGDNIRSESRQSPRSAWGRMAFATGHFFKLDRLCDGNVS